MILITKNKLRIGHLSTAYHTNFILMENDDLKNDLNLNINWILFGTGPAMVKAFENEELDIGYMGLPPAIIGIDRGVNIKCVAGGHLEGTIMVAKKVYKTMMQLNGKLEEVFAQFIGKVIGVPSKGSIHDVILNHYLKKYKLLNKIAVKNYEQAEFISVDMKGGILEAGVGTPALASFTSTILNSHIIILPRYFWANNPSYGIFFHNNLIENHPEIVITFLKHHKKAASLLRTSPVLAAEKIAKTLDIVDQTYIHSVLKISPKYCIALSEEFINSTMEFVKALRGIGYIKRILTIEDIFNTKFVQIVHPEANHY